MQDFHLDRHEELNNSMLFNKSKIGKLFGIKSIIIVILLLELLIIFPLPKQSIKSLFFLPIKVTIIDQSDQTIDGVRVFFLNIDKSIIKIQNPSQNNIAVAVTGSILAIPINKLHTIKEVRVSIGEKNFIYDRNILLNTWGFYCGDLKKELKNEDFVVLQAPSDLKINSNINKLFFFINEAKNIININPNLSTKFLPLFFGILFKLILLYFLLTLFINLFVPLKGKELQDWKILSQIHYERQNKFHYIQILFVFLITLFSASIFSRLGIDVHHQGFMFQVATSIYKGKILFRDVYFHYGPLTALLQAFTLKLFGNYLIAIQLLTAFFYALCSIFLWLICSRFIPPYFATITCIIWVFLAPYYVWEFLPWSSVYSLFSTLVALYAIIVFLDKKHYYWLWVGGISTALAFWFRQSVGIMLFLSVISFFVFLFICQIINRKDILKNLGFYISGTILTSLPFLIWLETNKEVNDWYLQNFLVHTDYLKGIGKKISAFLLLFPENLSLWVFVPIICILVFFVIVKNLMIFKKTYKSSLLLLIFIFVAFASWTQYSPVSCIRHTYWGGTPMFGIFAFFIWFLSKSIIFFSKKKNIFLSVSLSLVFLLSLTILGREVYCHIDRGVARIKDFNITLTYPEVLLGMKVQSQTQAVALQQLHVIINQHLKEHPHLNLVSLADSNILTLTFVDQNNSVCITQIPKLDKSILEKVYQCELKRSNIIKNKLALIFSNSRQTILDYFEIAHIPVKGFVNDGTDWYLYAPL